MTRFSRRQAREYDRRATEVYGMPSLLLMENAAAGVVSALLAAGMLRPERAPSRTSAIAEASHALRNTLQSVRGASYMIDHGLERLDESGRETPRGSADVPASPFELIRRGWEMCRQNHARFGEGLARLLELALAPAEAAARDTLATGGDDRRPVVVCCGGGNNGGDGFAIARRLDALGVRTRLLVWADPEKLPPDARVNYEIVRRAGLPLAHPAASHDLAAELRDASCVVDALLGTGAQGEPRDPIAGVVDAINASGLPVVAVDLPSGLDADSGVPATRAIRAHLTCTFAAEKLGFASLAARPFLGDVRVIDLGAPRRLLDEIAAEGE